MRRLFALSTLVLLAVPVFAQERPDSGAELESQIREAAESARERTVLVAGVIGMGSGAVISPRGRVITNAHVVAGARYALCRWPDGTQRLMRRLGIDYGNDLALLEPAESVESPLPAFTWRGSQPQTKTWVIGLGFPGGYRGDDWAVASLGQITGQAKGDRVSGVFDYDGALRSDTPIFSGNSGGPLVDLKGRLVGLNGAADMQGANALTIPEARIKERLGDLADGWIVLPTGMRLNPQRTPLLNAFYRATDGMARQLPERVMGAATSQAAGEPAPVLGDGSTSEAVRALIKVAADSPRQGRLRALRSTGPGAFLIGKRHAAAVGPRHLVTHSDSYVVGQRLRVGERTLNAVAISKDDRLVLFEVQGPPLQAFQLAPARPIGSLVHALAADRSFASGIVSSRARRVTSGFLNTLHGSGGPFDGALESLGGLVKRLNIAPLVELLEQIERAQQMRDAFAAGTNPTTHPWVLSIDVPVDPAQLGGPVVDRSGRLVGVSVGFAHHGTTFVVPWTRIWRVFGSRLKAAPTQRGALRLH